MTSPPRPSWLSGWKFLQKKKKAKHYKRFWPHISQGSRVAALIQDLPTQPLNGHDAHRVSRSVSGVMKLQWVVWKNKISKMIFIPDTCDFLCYRLKDVKKRTRNWRLVFQTVGSTTSHLVFLTISSDLWPPQWRDKKSIPFVKYYKTLRNPGFMITEE